ncbi:MAG: glycosyltransferase family 2 protein, partial [Pirellulaceae bacterium]|nr:glycosyltransferase family 2 protein [Pirellulaceae bacterium]
CLDSLLKNPPSTSYEVLVIDNCSVDDSCAQIAQRFPTVRLIHMETNAGLPKAFNRGIAESSGQFILSLDNDTIVNPGALDAMVEFLERTPGAGACGAKLVNPDGSPQHTARRFPHPLNALFGRGTLLTRWFPNNPISQGYLMSDSESSDGPYEVDTLSAACLMVRRAAIDQVGALDENFFVYWCDTDWCFRIKQGKWKIYSIPTVEIIHNENSRTRHRKGRRIRGVVDFHKGVYRFYRKHYVRSAYSPMNLVAIVGLSTRAGMLIAWDEVKRMAPRLGTGTKVK